MRIARDIHDAPAFGEKTGSLFAGKWFNKKPNHQYVICSEASAAGAVGLFDRLQDPMEYLRLRGIGSLEFTALNIAIVQSLNDDLRQIESKGDLFYFTLGNGIHIIADLFPGRRVNRRPPQKLLRSKFDDRLYRGTRGWIIRFHQKDGLPRYAQHLVQSSIWPGEMVKGFFAESIVEAVVFKRQLFGIFYGII